MAEKFGFKEDVHSDDFGDLLATGSLCPENLDVPGTALTGMGQGGLASTPMQMAMVTAAPANDGKLRQLPLRGARIQPSRPVVSQRRRDEVRASASPDHSNGIRCARPS
ncbi:hypothetical protein CP969_17410 [Streptomyces viridosporus T7A]|uniref:Penicillin-binding protein transpeptidase domain-containing protein n=1 Tax=Streptomyces viridosporus T7A TaxID=665577 RepID=A0ABX6AGQ5_STRVD|nr:hypothetical protein CP969_17410 [Streptomyces viridosporus T7A]